VLRPFPGLEPRYLLMCEPGWGTYLQVADQIGLRLLGAGDMVVRGSGARLIVPADPTVTGTPTSRLAVLDDALPFALRRWPLLAVRLLERLDQQAQMLAAQFVIAELPRRRSARAGAPVGARRALGIRECAGDPPTVEPHARDAWRTRCGTLSQSARASALEQTRRAAILRRQSRELGRRLADRGWR
jgi:hypothetical protein